MELAVILLEFVQSYNTEYNTQASAHGYEMKGVTLTK